MWITIKQNIVSNLKVKAHVIFVAVRASSTAVLDLFCRQGKKLLQ
jgi:hypothetical protein